MIWSKLFSIFVIFQKLRLKFGLLTMENVHFWDSLNNHEYSTVFTITLKYRDGSMRLDICRYHKCMVFICMYMYILLRVKEIYCYLNRIEMISTDWTKFIIFKLSPLLSFSHARFSNLLITALVIWNDDPICFLFPKWGPRLSQNDDPISISMTSLYQNDDLVLIKMTTQYQNEDPRWIKMTTQFQSQWQACIKMTTLYWLKWRPNIKMRTLYWLKWRPNVHLNDDCVKKWCFEVN